MLINSKQDDLKSNFTSSDWGKYVQEVQAALTAKSFNCPYECGKYQWAASGVTQNLPPEYYTKSYTSIAEIYPDDYANMIPELYAYGVLKSGQEIRLNERQLRNFFDEYSAGSLAVSFEFSKYIRAAQAGDIDLLNKRFAESGLAQYSPVFLDYCKQLFFGVYNLDSSLVTTVSAQDLIWGYNDPRAATLVSYSIVLDKLTYRQTGSPIDGFLPLQNSWINFGGKQNNLDEYGNSSTPLSTINTGTSDISKVRRYTSYNGYRQAKFIMPQYSDGAAIKNNYPINPYNVSLDVLYYSCLGLNYAQIDGTDAIGFSPLQSSHNDLHYFKEEYYRTLKLVYSQTLPNDEYEIVRYRVADSEFDVNPQYYTYKSGFNNLTYVKGGPYVASAPYFLGCIITKSHEHFKTNAFYYRRSHQRHN